MPDCDCLPGCPFFNDKMLNMPALSEMMKKRFCRGDFNSCARHKIKDALGKEKVPSDLFPSQLEKVEDIIQSNRSI
jgi:hypothetical protein